MYIYIYTYTYTYTGSFIYTRNTSGHIRSCMCGNRVPQKTLSIIKKELYKKNQDTAY